MAKIFLSHSSLDKPLARRIANDLKDAKHDVWLDEWKIYVGHVIPRQIQEGLEQSDFIAVLLTRNAIQSGWVEKEWQSRIAREIQLRSVEILPLKADDCEVPLLLRDKKWADFTDYATGMAELLTAISHHGGGTHPSSQSSQAGPPPRPPDETQPNAQSIPRRRHTVGFRMLAILIAAALLMYWVTSLFPSPDPLQKYVAPHPVTLPSSPTQTLAELSKDHRYGSDFNPRKITDLVECTPTGCSIWRSDLCSPDAKSLRLGRTEQANELTYDLQTCAATDEGDSGRYEACFSSPDEIFPLRPGATVFAALDYSDGSTLPFQIRVATSATTFNGAPEWAELAPEPGPDQGSAPFVAARINTTSYSTDVKRLMDHREDNEPFDLFVGTGGCSLVKPRVSKLLYDVDGRGLVEVPDIHVSSMDRPGDVTTQFSIPRLPKDSRVAIALENNEGKRFGPFSYQFDVRKVLEASAAKAGEPRLDCSAHGRQCVAPGSSAFLAWLHVERIEYGRAEDQLTRTAAIQISAAYFWSSEARRRLNKDRIARFAIPAGWDDVYYRLVLDDGRNTGVIRAPVD